MSIYCLQLWTWSNIWSSITPQRLSFPCRIAHVYIMYWLEYLTYHTHKHVHVAIHRSCPVFHPVSPYTTPVSSLNTAAAAVLTCRDVINELTSKARCILAPSRSVWYKHSCLPASTFSRNSCVSPGRPRDGNFKSSELSMSWYGGNESVGFIRNKVIHMMLLFVKFVSKLQLCFSLIFAQWIAGKLRSYVWPVCVFVTLWENAWCKHVAIEFIVF